MLVKWVQPLNQRKGSGEKERERERGYRVFTTSENAAECYELECEKQAAAAVERNVETCIACCVCVKATGFGNAKRT